MLAEKLREAHEKNVLYLAAVEALRRTGGNEERALGLFREALAIAARDMNSGRKPGVGHVAFETQVASADVNSGGNPSAGHHCVETQKEIARDNSESDWDLKSRAAQNGGVPVTLRPIDRTARSRAAIVARQVDAGIFDTKISDGRAIGNVYGREVNALERASAFENKLFKSIRNHVPNPPDGAQIRDYIAPDMLELFIAQARHANDGD